MKETETEQDMMNWIVEDMHYLISEVSSGRAKTLVEKIGLI